MYNYTTKSIESIKRDAKVICNNLAPLIGCRIGNLKWSPKTAFNVCNNLEISGLKCTNISDDYVTDDVMSYRFDSSVTKHAGEVRNLVKGYNKSILDEYYTSILPVSSIPSDANLSKKFQLTSRISVFTDSTILDASCENKSIQNLAICRNVCHVMLSSFSTRYLLVKYYTSEDELDTAEVNTKNINRIINNIDYIKFMLSRSNINEVRYLNSSNFLCQQLTTLRKNLFMIKYYVLDYVE